MRNARIQQVLTRVRGTFAGFTNGQKAVTIVAVVVAVVGGVVFYMWASQPAMTQLYSNLSETDAGAITTSLEEKGVPYELASGGTTILVPRAQSQQLKLDLAGEGLPANSEDSQGYGLVEDAPMTTSDAQQQVLIKRATEGELTTTIERIDTVKEAKVQLALPANDVFTRDQVPPTASVLVTPEPDKEVSASQVEAIVHLTAAAIPKLTAAGVTVTDSTGRLLSTQGGGSAGAQEARLAQQQAVGSTIGQQVQAMLDKAVGSGNSSVSVQADLNYDDTQVVTNEYIQPPAGAPPLQVDEANETLQGNGQTPVGGVLGPDNIPVPQANAGQANQDWEKNSNKAVNPYGTRRTTTSPANGQVRRLSVAVMLDARTAAAVNQQQITDLVTTAAGADPARGDVVTVNRLPFDTAAAQREAAEEAAAAEQQRREELLGLAKNVALGLLLLLALLIGFRRSRKRTRTVELGELRSVQSGLPQLTAGEQAAIAPPAEYELDELPVLEATPVDPQSDARNAARLEIAQLVEENPDEVARLLRGWMSERS